MTSRAFNGALGAVATVAGCLGADVANARITDVTPLVSSGKFKLRDGDSKVIVDRSIGDAYRICVWQAARAVPLKVTAHLADTLVEPGECHTFSAQYIRITPSAALEEDAVLIGTYERVEL